MSRVAVNAHLWREPVAGDGLVTIGCAEHLHGRCPDKVAPTKVQRSRGLRSHACRCWCHAPSMAGNQLTLESTS